jgi:hypothetical protein
LKGYSTATARTYLNEIAQFYLHVKRKELINLINPLDELYMGKDWDS